MVCGGTRSTDQVIGEAFVKDAAATRPRPGGAAAAADPVVVLGLDVFFNNVLPRLDARSLAACTAVCPAWRTFCSSDVLWSPLLSRFLADRAHIPLPLLRCPTAFSPHVAYSIAMFDAAKVELTPEEMCARIWELRVKPTCGSYWCSLDPTSRGEDPLLRRFQCDHSITSLQDKDPIWGGQESCWQFVKAIDGKQGVQYVKINSWPQHRVVRLPDGQWCLDNHYASYTTCPDQEQNMPAYLKGKVIDSCAWCNPEASKKEDEHIRGSRKFDARASHFRHQGSAFKAQFGSPDGYYCVAPGHS